MTKLTAIVITLLIAVGALMLPGQPGNNAPESPAATLPQEDTAAPITYEEITGEVDEITGEYILFTDANGQQVQANLFDATVFEGTAPTVGSVITVVFDGKMTRSLPGQITAIKVVCHALTGTIEELSEDGFLLRRDDVDDQVYVHATADQSNGLLLDDSVTVYFNGVMTMSLPGQISAQKIVKAE